MVIEGMLKMVTAGAQESLHEASIESNPVHANVPEIIREWQPDDEPK